jgi:hypothetical protein
VSAALRLIPASLQQLEANLDMLLSDMARQGQPWWMVAIEILGGGIVTLVATHIGNKPKRDEISLEKERLAHEREKERNAKELELQKLEIKRKELELEERKLAMQREKDKPQSPPNS